MPDLEVEKQLAVWVRKERRGRYRATVPGRRSQALLLNSNTLDMDLAEEFYPSDSAEVVEILRRAGAPARCYVIAHELEGEHVDLPTGVDAAMTTGEGFVSCIHGRLAYVQLEDWGRIDLLLRR